MRTSERLIQSAVLQHWHAFGLPGTLVAAIPNAKAFGQAGLTKGLFDLIVLTPQLGGLTGWLELKAADGALSAAQEAFRVTLIKVGAPYAVTYGRDEPIRVLEHWGAVRGSA